MSTKTPGQDSLPEHDGDRWDGAAMEMGILSASTRLRDRPTPVGLSVNAGRGLVPENSVYRYFDNKGDHTPTKEQLENLQRAEYILGISIADNHPLIDDAKLLEEAIRLGMAGLVVGSSAVAFVSEGFVSKAFAGEPWLKGSREVVLQIVAPGDPANLDGSIIGVDSVIMPGSVARDCLIGPKQVVGKGELVISEQEPFSQFADYSGDGPAEIGARPL